MSKSTTPTYRVELDVLGSLYTPQAWPYTIYRQPTDESLTRFVEDFEASTREGGVNAHLGEEFVMSAQVVHQSTGQVVASYEQPFRVVS